MSSQTPQITQLIVNWEIFKKWTQNLMRGVHFIFKYQSSDLYWNIPKNMADKSAIKYNYYWNSFNLSSSQFNDSILVTVVY